MMAPPDPAASKLIEPGKAPNPVIASPIPDVVASAPSATDAEADDDAAPKVSLQRTEFGVDLGTANSVNGLRMLWRGLLKSRSNAPLAALRPIIVIKESTKGLGMQLRLVAGPLERRRRRRQDLRRPDRKQPALRDRDLRRPAAVAEVG